MPRPTGKAGCERCQGKGGWLDEDGWVRCPCTRARRAASEAVRRANEQPGRPWRMPGTSP